MVHKFTLCFCSSMFLLLYACNLQGGTAWFIDYALSPLNACLSQ